MDELSAVCIGATWSLDAVLWVVAWVWSSVALVLLSPFEQAVKPTTEPIKAAIKILRMMLVSLSKFRPKNSIVPHFISRLPIENVGVTSHSQQFRYLNRKYFTCKAIPSINSHKLTNSEQISLILFKNKLVSSPPSLIAVFARRSRSLFLHLLLTLAEQNLSLARLKHVVGAWVQ